ncbi:MAG: hypothetical protein M0Z34_04065 [Nitrospiraceae bacterium]|nr:hypothetical protein [Nitrospiraceae bacterium]
MAANERQMGPAKSFHSSFGTGLWGMERLELGVAIGALAVGGLILGMHLGPGEGLFGATAVALLGLALGAVRIQEVSAASLIGRMAAFALRSQARTSLTSSAGACEALAYEIALNRSPYLEGSAGRQELARLLSGVLDSLARSESPTALAAFSTSRVRPGSPREWQPPSFGVGDSYAAELAELEERLLAREQGPESFLVLLPATPSAGVDALAGARSIAAELFARRLPADGGKLSTILPRDGRLRERFSSLGAAGEKLVIYSVARWPHRAGPGVFARLLLNSPTRFVVAVLFEPAAPERLARVVRTRRTRLEADGRLGAEMGYMRGAQRQLLRAALGEAEGQVLAGRAGVVMSALVIAWHPPGDRENLPATFAMSGITLRREFGRQAEALGAVLRMAGR